MSHLDILVLLVVVLLIFQKLRSILGTNHEERQIHLSKESAEKLYDILAKENGKQYTSPAEMCSPARYFSLNVILFLLLQIFKNRDLLIIDMLPHRQPGLLHMPEA